MPRTLLEAMDAQKDQLAELKRALRHLHLELSGFGQGLVQELDDYFLIPAKKMHELNKAFETLDETRIPDALELDGKWSDLLDGVDPPNNFSAAKSRLGEIIHERRAYIDGLKELSRTSERLVELTEEMARDVRKTAEKFMDRDLRGLPTEVKIADLLTNYITLRGLDLMDSLVAGTADRAAQMETLQQQLTRTITTLERDLRALERSRDIMDFLGIDRASWPEAAQLNDSAVFGEPAYKITRITGEATNALISRLEEKDALLEQAAKQAKRDTVLGRWQASLSLGSAFLGFSDALKRLSAPSGASGPVYVTIGEEAIPISREALEALKSGGGIGIDLLYTLVMDGRVFSYRHTKTRLRTPE